MAKSDFKPLDTDELPEELLDMLDAMLSGDEAALTAHGMVRSPSHHQAAVKEEAAAIAESIRQLRLVRFFETPGATPTASLVDDFLAEQNLEPANTPLWRRYFREGNAQLVALLHLSVSLSPTDPDRLYDLGIYHGFHPCWAPLSAAYLTACRAECDPENLEELVSDFCAHIQPSDPCAFAFLLADSKLSAPQKAVITSCRYRVLGEQPDVTWH